MTDLNLNELDVGLKPTQSITSEAIKKSGEEQKSTARVHLFFSFDIVNSTKYKEVTSNWPIIIQKLITDIRSRVARSSVLASSYLWRVIGDEIIFVLPIYVKENLINVVNSIFEETQYVTLRLKNGKFFEGIEDQNLEIKEINILKSQGILSIKSAAWIAAINTEMSNQYDNITTTYQTDSHREPIKEYLGQDIDTGFRLKAYTQDRRLVISYELAYYLTELNEAKNLFIIDYVKLKGVWNGGLYPIIWYYNEDIYKKCNIELNGERMWIPFTESFRYDEMEENQLVSSFLSRIEYESNHISQKTKLNPQMYKIDCALRKIASDRNLMPKFKYMDSLFKEIEMEPVKLKEYPLELHCTVVCYNPFNKTIMITKRSKNHTMYSDDWEFGCVKAENSSKLIDSVVQGYRNRFGIKIDLILDKNRQDKQPTPIAIYEIDDSQNNIRKGIILLAKVTSTEETKPFRENDSHLQMKWIAQDQIAEYAAKGAVPDFTDTANKAFDFFKG